METKANKSNLSYVESLLYHSASQSNILPITSTCNVRCIFCSHRQNPPRTESYRIPPLTMEQVKTAISFMDPDIPVVIGESVTKIMEGEPLTHPRWQEIMQEIRDSFPKTPIQLTTNGNLLTNSVIEKLSELAPISINLSLNSASSSGREKLMMDKLAHQAINSARLLQEYNIPFHGSIVAMPHITGWQDLTDAVLYLDQCLAKTVRVFLPGYTAFAPKELQFNQNMWQQLRNHVKGLRSRVAVPITCEPEQLDNLRAEVVGVIKNSPAQQAGMKPGDLILEVSEEVVLSRVHAFNQVLNTDNPLLKVKRKSNVMNIKLAKEAGDSSGLVMAYDIYPDTIQEIEKAARRNRSEKTVVLASQLAYQVLKRAVDVVAYGDSSFHIQAVKSRYFGGSIMAAGLLLVDDFNAALEEIAFSNKNFQLILLPSIAFDMHGRDLGGNSYLELQQKWGVPVELI
ncbi:MAG: DUF512 domain-containing protein [Firmicutes bacterium]|nr:DUF512 domain-containing protein [Bacillota bacterium]